jgi:hypothetical protein
MSRSDVVAMTPPSSYDADTSPSESKAIAFDPNAVIPTGAERSEAKWRDLFLKHLPLKEVPRLRFASLGTTGFRSNAIDLPSDWGGFA